MSSFKTVKELRVEEVLFTYIFCYLRLFVVQGKPEVELPRLFKQWKITKLTFEFDHEPDGRVRDTKISEHASDVGIEVETKICHSLYDLDK